MKEAYTVILLPEDNPYTKAEINDFMEAVVPQLHYKIIYFPLEKFIMIIKQIYLQEFMQWIENFDERYVVYRG